MGTYCMIPFIGKSRKDNLIYNDKAYQQLPWERSQGNFWGDTYIVYLDCEVGYQSVQICQYSSKCILKTGVFLYVNYICMKLI